jgi:hypothetical protein
LVRLSNKFLAESTKLLNFGSKSSKDKLAKSNASLVLVTSSFASETSLCASLTACLASSIPSFAFATASCASNKDY